MTVTTNILGDVVENLVGDAVEVVTVMPVGADPHDFQASARQVEQMQSAAAVIVNGGGFEEGLLDVIEGIESDGTPVYAAITGVLSDLDHEVPLAVVDGRVRHTKRRVDLREHALGELHVDYGADDLGNATLGKVRNFDCCCHRDPLVGSVGCRGQMTVTHRVGD